MKAMTAIRAVGVWLLCTSLVSAQVADLLHWGEAQAQAEAEKQAEDAILREVGQVVGISAPIALNQTHAYPEVAPLQDFHPTALTPTVGDLKSILPPGDYSIPVTGYCTRSSAHYPGRGLAYKMGPLQGPQAPAMAALLVRGAIAHVPSGSLQGVAWFIQWGTPLDSMGDQARALIHQLIPEFEESLKGDFLDKIQSTYDQFKAVPGLPPLDSLLAKTEEGQYILSVRRARATLMDKTISAEEMPDRLYQPTADGLPRVLPDANPPAISPWQQLRPGLYARFTFTGGFASQNLFEFRITQEAVRTAQWDPDAPARLIPVQLGATAAGYSLEEILVLAPLLPEAAPIIVSAALITGGVLLVAYAIGGLAQPLTVAPIFQSENGSGKTRAPPGDAKDPNGSKAPGKPGAAEGFEDPKGGETWGQAKDGNWGWVDSGGKVWVPTGQGPRAHGGPHWDVNNPDGTYNNVYPGGKTRPGAKK